MSTNWADEVAIVTGGAGAMGGAVVRELLSRGSRVAALDTAAALESLDSRFGGSGFLAVPVDLKSRQSIGEAFDTVDSGLGTVTMLANFAATAAPAHSILEATTEEWDHVIGVNLAGTFWTCQEALKRMMPKRRGSIVNIASLNGFKARPSLWTHIYGISKAGVIGLTTNLASEAGHHGIRVNCISPGLHKGPMLAQGTANAGAANAYLQAWIDNSALHCVGEPEDMVGPALFLLSEDSRYMTGQMLTSDGGKSILY